MFSLHNCLVATFVAHLLVTAVISIFARHKVEYLSLAWIMGIFSAIILAVLAIEPLVLSSNPGMLHPAMMLALMATIFLQSIYPLGITMPAYLQWGRSWRYAAPAVVLFAIYGCFLAIGVRPIVIRHWADIPQNLFNSDISLRIAMLALSIYYIVNIFRMPRVMLRNPDTPHYLFGYAFALGLSLCLYTWLAIDFSITLLCSWIVVFTMVNLYLCFRVLETIAVGLPLPKIIEETDDDAEEYPDGTLTQQQEKSNQQGDAGDETAQEDFNEANQRRFEQMEHWMQHNRHIWRDYRFGRDQLCANTGINRFLMLQSVRSQGYYNIHDYISRHRIAEVQRMIRRGEVHSVVDCLDAGFASTKTLRSSFEKYTGQTIDSQFPAAKTR